VIEGSSVNGKCFTGGSERTRVRTLFFTAYGDSTDRPGLRAFLFVRGVSPPDLMLAVVTAWPRIKLFKTQGTIGGR